MKKKTLIRLTLAFAGSLLAGVGLALAQERTLTPEEETPLVEPFPGDNMPILRNYVPPSSMPMPKMWGMTTDPKTGKVLTYTDTQSGLRFDFQRELITDYKTGKTYKFSEHPAYRPKKKS
jgi:hypothetical protein